MSGLKVERWVQLLRNPWIDLSVESWIQYLRIPCKMNITYPMMFCKSYIIVRYYAVVHPMKAQYLCTTSQVEIFTRHHHQSQNQPNERNCQYHGKCWPGASSVLLALAPGSLTLCPNPCCSCLCWGLQMTKKKTNTKTNTKKKTNTKAKFCPPALIGSHTTSPLSVKELGLEIRLKPLPLLPVRTFKWQ